MLLVKNFEALHPTGPYITNPNPTTAGAASCRTAAVTLFTSLRRRSPSESDGSRGRGPRARDSPIVAVSTVTFPGWVGLPLVRT